MISPRIGVRPSRDPSHQASVPGLDCRAAQNIHHLELGERCPMKRVFFSIAAAAAIAVTASAASAQTLKTVQSRGTLNCGANGVLGGFGLPDAQGNWTGLDVDFCRAVAAAIFNDASKVKFVALTAKDRFTATNLTLLASLK